MKNMSEKLNNMDLFNKFVVELLADLYSKFPVQQDIMIEKYTYLDSNERNSIFYSSIRFLEQERFVTYSKDIYGGFLKVALTSKSLKLLGEPDTLSKSKTLYSRIKETIEIGTSEAYGLLVKEIINQSINTAIEKITNE